MQIGAFSVGKNMINGLLGKNWTVTEVKETEDSVTIYATYDLMPEVCLRCGAINPKYHRRSVETIRYAEAPIYGLKTTLVVDAARLECLECEETFMQPLPGITPRRRLTDRCIRYIEREVVTETYAKITRLVNVSEKTVRSIERAAAVKREKNHVEFSPLVLGIDDDDGIGHLPTPPSEGQRDWSRA